MKQPQLTQKVEKALLTQIEQVEQKAVKNRQPISAEPYLKLAELYRFHGQSQFELAILNRFLEFDFANESDKQKVALRRQQLKNKLAAEADQTLQLAGTEGAARATDLSGQSDSHSGEQVIEPVVDLERVGEGIDLIPKEEEQLIQSRQLPKAKERDLQNKPRYRDTDFKFITLCAAWTGSETDDELVELSLLLAQKLASDTKPRILQSVTMRRKPHKPIPAACVNQFGLNKPGEYSDFDIEKVRALFAEADFVISHNHPEIDRQVLAVLIPELADKDWYSTQKGIPWKALGFETARLTTICRDLHIRLVSTTMGRARAIFEILCQPEPFSEHIFLRRIYNLPPIKPMEWTPALRRTQKRLARKPGRAWLWIALLSLLSLGLALWYFADQWLPLLN